MDQRTGRYLVTGAGGFVGKALCKALRKQGYNVTGISRGAYPELEAIGVEMVRADIGTTEGNWQDRFEGVDGVFHTAAKVDMWGKLEDFMRTNVVGTANIIAACKRHFVRSLVFTSSPSVVADGSDLNGVDESYPYPQKYEAYYPWTKSLAEKAVRSADDDELSTVCLRPHLIWGPGDTNLIPTILERAKAGRLIRVGEGRNKTDLTFIDDCVNAHLSAMKALEENPEKVGGKVYFISQGDPVYMWEWIDHLLIANGLPPVKKKISSGMAHAIAWGSEMFSMIAGMVGWEKEPLLTRFLVSEMSTSHYFNITRAREDLGYIPSCSISEAMRKSFPENSGK